MTSLNLVSDAPESSSSKAPGRKVSPHPSTMEMVKEALKELDSRKGVSAQAIRGYIKEKYATVDETRLKFMVRRALNKGIETGVFVRPANSGSTTTGAQGRFRVTSVFVRHFMKHFKDLILCNDCVSYFRLQRPKQRRPRLSQRKTLIPMYRKHPNLRKRRQLKPRVTVSLQLLICCRCHFLARFFSSHLVLFSQGLFTPRIGSNLNLKCALWLC